MYFFLTAYRDYRDNYGIEILQELGLGDQAGVFSKTEIPNAFGVMLALSLLCLIRSNRVSLIFAFILMTSGQILMGVSTWMLQNDMLDGIQWMTLIGLGVYLTYVPFGTVLFDRLLAYTRFAGTAVFAIYLTDAIGYTGSIGLQIYKDQFLTDTSRLEFFQQLTYAMSIGGSISLLASLAYFMRRGSGPAQGA
jgi:hypothetical protein